jgi:hypothetical protein
MIRFITVVLSAIVLDGCALVDWHCTNGGQWSSYYSTGDGRCTYFCADVEERYCASTPLVAEEKQRAAEYAALQSNPDYQAFVEEQKRLQRERDTAACHDFGFKDGTDAMATCMLTQSQNRREDAVAQQRAFQEANQQQLQKQANDLARAAAVQSVINSSAKAVQDNIKSNAAVQGNINSIKTTTCRTTPSGTGAVTNCTGY